MDNQNQQPVTDQGGVPQAPVQPEPQAPVTEPTTPVSEPVVPTPEPAVPGVPTPEPSTPVSEPVVPTPEPTVPPAGQPAQDPNQGGGTPAGTL